MNEISRGSVGKTIKAEYYISILEDLEDKRYLLLQEILDNLVESRGILIEKVSKIKCFKGLWSSMHLNCIKTIQVRFKYI
ncbi:MAG: hypothetical protein ACLS7V_07980 [Enterococcus durans]